MKDGKKLIARARQARAEAQSTSAPTTCSPPATARRRSSGARPTPTPRTPAASRSTTGRSSIASSTRISSAACKPYVQIGFMPKALSVKPEPYQHTWTPGGEVRRDLHRLGLPAEGLQEVGRAGLPVGEALRREVRQGRGRDLVLGDLERAEHRLLARHAGGVPQAARLRHRRRAAGAADGARRRPRHRRPRRPVRARLLRAPAARHELRDRQGRHADRLRRRSTPRAGRRSSTATCRMGIAEPAPRRSTRASASSRRSPS